MLVSLALLMFGSTSNVFSAQLDRVFTKEFYERILSCPQIQITCLEKHDLIEEISPNLYALKNVRQGTEEERVSGARIVKAIRRPLLLIPDLPGLSGVPTVDAIVFSNDGDPVANLSIKSFLGDSKNGAMALKRNILSGRGSFKTPCTIRIICPTASASL